ncbi:MAG: PAS domain-containing protein, partial [Methanosarcina sp.]|uniref:PAS domain-containing protein n=1 Tax=Methanosarcina sp. TaxID=2213 RepID=UPI002615C65C
MPSTVLDLGNAKQNNSLNNLVEDDDSTAKEISSLIDSLPVTVFRVSSESSWAIHYIGKSVEKLTGYSKMEFISQKLSWSDIILPEDLSLVDKTVQKAIKN